MTNTKNNPDGTQRANMITQDDLRELRELREAKSMIEKRAATLRDRILSAYDADTTVEPGDLAIQVKQTDRRALTHSNVALVVGEAGLRRILEGIEPKTSRELQVVNTPAKYRPIRGFETDEPEFVDEPPLKPARHRVPAKLKTPTPVVDDDEFHPDEIINPGS